MKRYLAVIWILCAFLGLTLSGCDKDDDASLAKGQRCVVAPQQGGSLGIVCNDGHQVDVFYADKDQANCVVKESETVTHIICRDRAIISYPPGQDGQPGAAGEAGRDGRNALVRLEPVAPGENCEYGGVAAHSGHDENGDGALSDEEIQSTTYICNGEDGQPGLPGPNGQAGSEGTAGQTGQAGKSNLVTIVSEPAGANCARGGYAVKSGVDANDNGLLDDEEIAQTSYVCHGQDGASGTTSDGKPGNAALIRLDVEEPGANCPTGGIAILSGLDSDGDNELSDEEVTSTQYICNGETGAPGADGSPGSTGGAGSDGNVVLVRTVSEPQGANCPAGGVAILVGFDENNNGVLDENEVDSDQTTYVCNIIGNLTFTAHPTITFNAGSSFGVVAIEVKQPDGALMTSFVGNAVLSLAHNPGNAQLVGVTEQPVVDGVATFPGVSVEEAGQGYTLMATVAGFTSAVSNPFDVEPGPASVVSSTISADLEVGGEVVANGTDELTVVVVLEDAFGNPIEGTIPTFEATGSGNTYGACTPTDGSGESRCTMTSTVAEEKSLLITSPISMQGDDVVFMPGPPSTTHSTIAPTVDAVTTVGDFAGITIVLKDAQDNPVAGVVPTFSATGTGNTYQLCTESDQDGESLCTMTSTAAGEKTLSITSPITMGGGAVTFGPGQPSATTSGIVVAPGNEQVVAGEALTVWVSVLDEYGNPIEGVEPEFEATGDGNDYEGCTLTDDTGLAICTMRTTVAESKSLKMTYPVSTSGGGGGGGSGGGSSSFVCIPGLAAETSSSITGESGKVADGVESATVWITIRDGYHNGIPDVVPVFSASGSGNTYENCSATDATGVATCSMRSTVAQTKTLSMTSPFTKSGDAIAFVAGPVDASTSDIFGTSNVLADGITISQITVVLRDAFNNAVAAVVPEFAASGSGNVPNGCTASNASGVSTCTMSSTVAEQKVLSLTAPITKQGGTIEFVDEVPEEPACDTFTFTSPAFPPPGWQTGGDASWVRTADYGFIEGTSALSGTIDHNQETWLETTYQFGPGGGKIEFHWTVSSEHNHDFLVYCENRETCTRWSYDARIAGLRTLNHWTKVTREIEEPGEYTLRWAYSKDGSTSSGQDRGWIDNVRFSHNGGGCPSNVSQANSTIEGPDTPVAANGVARGVVTITLRDAGGHGVEGLIPGFEATGNSNTYELCTVTDASGVSTCEMSSTDIESKDLAITWPVQKAEGSIEFITPAPAVADNSSIFASTDNVPANGVSTAEITIVLRDINDLPVAAVVPEFEATGTENDYGTCTMTDHAGISTCEMSSSVAEVKTLSITSPVVQEDESVTFAPPAPASPAKSSIVSETAITRANGFSQAEIVIVLRDEADFPIIGEVPEFGASGGGNNYLDCTATDHDGVSSCAMTSTEHGIKSLSLTAPIAMSGGTVEFEEVDFINGCDPGILPFGGGDGSTHNPYLICSVSQFNQISSSNDYLEKDFQLRNDLDFGGTTFSTIGGFNLSEAYGGVFDGNYHRIFNISTSPSGSYAGMFRRVGSTGIIKNLGLENVTINGLNQVGAIVGRLDGGVIENSYARGSVHASSSPIGGLLGYSSNGTVVDSYFEGDVSCSSTFSNLNVGGVVGYQTGASASISRVYATGNITANSAGGVLGGRQNGSVTHAYWDKETTGQETSAFVGTLGALTTAEMADPTSYNASWIFFPDNNHTWVMHQGYPRLAWELPQVVDVDVTNSTISGVADVYANGVSEGVVTITLRDASGEGVQGISPLFEGSRTGNHYGPCSESNEIGVSTCTITATAVGEQVLSITWPVTKADGTIEFNAPNVTDASNSTIEGTTDIPANGYWWSTVSIVLNDENNEPVAGIVPEFEASGSGNVYADCTMTDVSGQSTCELRSTVAEEKTLSITSPVTKADGSVTFTEVGYVEGCDPTMFFGGGDGSAGDPYLICTPEQLNRIGADDTLWDKSFKLSTDIDMDGMDFNMIGGTGSNDGYRGTFDGNYKRISNLTIPYVFATREYVGVFRRLTSAGVVKNLGLVDSSISGYRWVGGFVGLSDGRIENSYSYADVETTTSTFSRFTGGLVGYNTGVVIDSYSAGSVSSISTQSTNGVGGVVGYQTLSGAILNRVYARGSVDAPSDVGGVVGRYGNGAILHAYWDMETTGQATSDGLGATGLTSDEMDDFDSYDSSWVFHPSPDYKWILNDGYPRLAWELPKVEDVDVTNSTISGVSGVYANGVSPAEITIYLRDADGEGVAGLTPRFEGDLSGNEYTHCSLTDEDGLSTCTMTATLPGMQTLSLTWPVTKADGQVDFHSPNFADAANSTIEGTTDVPANGYWWSTITVTLKDDIGDPVGGVVPEFEASGSENVYSDCSMTDSDGIATCTMTSTVAETKTLSLTYPVSKVGGDVTFTEIVLIAGCDPTMFFGGGDGSSGEPYLICAPHQLSNIGDVEEHMSAHFRLTADIDMDGVVAHMIGGTSENTGFAGVFDGNGHTITNLMLDYTGSHVGLFRNISTDGEVKNLGIEQAFVKGTSYNGSLAGRSTGTVENVHVRDSQISGTSFVGGLIGYQYGAQVSNVSVENSGVYGSSNAGGLIGTVDSSSQVLALVQNAHATGEVRNVGGSSHGSFGGLIGRASRAEIEDSYSSAKITAVAGYAGGLVGYASTTGYIRRSYATGNVTISGALDYSARAGGLVGEVSSVQVEESFATGDVNAANSLAGGLVGRFWNGDGSPMMIRDSYATGNVSSNFNGVGGLIGELAKGSVQTSYSTGGVEGISAQEQVGLSIGARDVNESGLHHVYYNEDRACINISAPCNNEGTALDSAQLGDVTNFHASWVFSPDDDHKWVMYEGRPYLWWQMPAIDAVDAEESSIVGQSGVRANGYSEAVITVTLKNSQGGGMAGVRPQFEATGAGNIYGECSVSDAYGLSTCSLRTTESGTKTLSITSPVNKVGGEITFIEALEAVAGNSSISGTTNVAANGKNESVITIALRDINNDPVAGQVPTFGATGNGNAYGDCSVSDEYGESFCTLRSTVAETKELSITSPVEKTGGSVTFFDVTLINGCDPYATFGGGDGSSAQPYLICTPEQFNNIGQNNAYLSAHFRLVQDLDFTGIDVNMAGSSLVGFSGVFDGDLYSISNVVFDSSAVDDWLVGMFRKIEESGEVRNLALTNITAETYWGAGALAGENYGTISNCQVSDVYVYGWGAVGGLAGSSYGVIRDSGVMSTAIVGQGYAGGLVGEASGLITHSYSTANIASFSQEGQEMADSYSNGGLVGDFSDGEIRNSFATGDVNGIVPQLDSQWSYSLGGLVGYLVRSEIHDSYALGDVLGQWEVGGLVGYSRDSLIDKSYASGRVIGVESVGGLLGLGDRESSVQSSFATGEVIASTYIDGLETAHYVNYVGGLVGLIRSASVYNSFATGHLISDGPYAGGLIGRMELGWASGSEPGEVQHSYALGNVASTSDQVGGLIGGLNAGQVSASYALGNISGNSASADVGRLLGWMSDSNATLTHSYYRTSASCTNTGSATGCNTIGVARTVEQFEDTSTYHASWIFTPDDNYVWVMHQQRPHLWWEMFAADPVDANNSTISGESGALANGIEQAEVLIVLRDGDDDGVAGVIPQFEASGSGNIYGPCTATNIDGEATCTMTSTVVETKTLSITWPVEVDGGTIAFVPPPVVENSSIVGTTNIPANGVNESVITIELRDATNTPVVGKVPAFEASGTGNSYGTCSETDQDGVSTCTMTSTVAETKTLSITSPIIKEDGDVTFFEVVLVNGCDPYQTFGGGNGSENTPYLICSVAQFNQIGDDETLMQKHFKLTTDLDFDGQSVVMIGGEEYWDDKGFAGVFDGDFYVLSNIVLDYPDDSSIGLFRTVQEDGIVRNLGMESVDVHGRSETGAIVGTNLGKISHCFVADGIVQGIFMIGGVVGYNVDDGIVEDSYAAVTVDGDNIIGGFVGQNHQAHIFRSYATGDVFSTDSGLAGGFAGYHTGSAGEGIIAESFASGNVTSEGYMVGGFVGWFDGPTVTDSYSTGQVVGAGDLGGFVGSLGYGVIERSYATGNVTAIGDNGLVGGFVGKGFSESFIRQSYASGDVIAANPDNLELWSMGGFVGRSRGVTIEESFATGNVYGKGQHYGGFVGFMLDHNWSTVDTVIRDSYATGNVVVEGANAGGLVGTANGGEIIRSYALGEVQGFDDDANSIGPLVGNFNGSSATMTHSYFNSSIMCANGGDGNCNTIGGALTPGEMEESTNYDASWVFSPDENNVWMMHNSRPYLWWQFLNVDQVDAANSSIAGDTGVVADGVTLAEIVIVLKDDADQGLAGIEPLFEASGTGNTYGACSISNAEGLSLCTMSSTVAESKTLSIMWPISKTGQMIVFE